jgi:hypothetical protein
MSGPEPDAVILITVEPTLRFFAACFRRLAVDWCVAGAVAANAYRDPRATGDIDLVVQIDATKFPAVAAALAEGGWVMVRRSPESDYPDIVRLRHPSHFPTDLLLVKTAYQREALLRAHAAVTDAGAVFVLTVEDVIIHKLIADRHRDRADIHEILRQKPALDRDYIERWCDFWEVRDRWTTALNDVA